MCYLLLFPCCFQYFIFVLIFLSISLVCVSACFFLGLSSMGLCNFLDLVDYFHSHVREVFDYNLFKYFLRPFLFFFFFWYPYNLNVCAFNIVPQVSKTVLISFYYFFLYYVPQQLFPPFCLPALSSILLPHLFCY